MVKLHTLEEISSELEVYAGERNVKKKQQNNGR